MEIASQRQLRAHGQPDFCYLCGEVLDGSVRTNRDHCPPKAFFATPDRENFPILLPTHETCNNKWHKADEIISIVADALHTKNKSQNAALTRKLDAKKVQIGSSSVAAISNFPLAPMAARIVRGMHALLYHDFMPEKTRSKFHVPIPEADKDSLRMRVPLEQTFAFLRVLNKALLTNTADVVRAYNGKFKYACTWEKLDDGTPFCIACFDIYSFHILSPPVERFPSVFLGMYIPTHVPINASWASELDVPFQNEDLLHPWVQT